MKLNFLTFFFVLVLSYEVICGSKKNGKCRLTKEDESCVVVKIVKIINGNTVNVTVVKDTTCKMKTFHLYGIETPKLKGKFGINAKKNLEKILKKKKYFLAKIRKVRTVCKELMGTLFFKEMDINKKMITDGYAWCKNPKNCPKSYYEATLKTMKHHKGIWRKNNTLKSTIKPKRKNIGKILRGQYKITITKVIDGDTVYGKLLNSSNKSIIKIRMGGIDAPEMKQLYGKEAKNKLEQIIKNSPNKNFQLRVEETDIYGRSIGYLSIKGLDINKAMIDSGYAWCYRYTNCPVSYQKSMQVAKKLRKGLFKSENPMTPWDWRKLNQRKN